MFTDVIEIKYSTHFFNLYYPTLRQTAMPTLVPSRAPSNMPSSMPSSLPTLSGQPTGRCGNEKSLVEIILEGNEFMDEISWNIQDVHGNVLIYGPIEGGDANDGGYYAVTECIPLNGCYTFSIHDSFEGGVVGNGNYRGLFTVKLDGEKIVSGSTFPRDQTIMFGDACLHNGDAVCTTSNLTTGSFTPMSMFRMELVAQNYDREISWKLVDSTNNVIRSAGPIGNCHVNSLAMCLPRQDCYQFIIFDDDDERKCCSYDEGIVTVLFSERDGLIQNFTGAVFSDMQRLFLGTCYGMNFGSY